MKTDENGSREAIGRGKARWEEVVFLREQFFDFCTTRLLNCGFHILLSGSVFLLLFGFCFFSNFPDPKDSPGVLAKSSDSLASVPQTPPQCEVGSLNTG